MKKQIVFALAITTSLALKADKPKNVHEIKDLKIGYADSFSVMRTSKPGEIARIELEKKRQDYTVEIQKIQLDLQKEQQELVKAENDLKTKAATLSRDALDKEQEKLVKGKRELESKVKNLETKAKEYEEDLQIAMQRKTEELAQTVEESMILVAKKQGLDAMVDKVSGRVVWSKPELDYTEYTIKEVDTKHELAQGKKKEDTTKLAQKSGQNKAATA